MKIKMKAQISGLRDGKDWPAPGEEVTVSDEEGATLCDAGLAEPVASKSSDTAEKRPAKKAAEKRASSKG